MEQTRGSHALDPDYPTPPELPVAAWKALLRTSTVTAPHVLATIDGSLQQSSAQDDLTRHNDFYRRACWAPDGSTLLAVTESQQTHIFGCRGSSEQDSSSSSRQVLELLSKRRSPSPLLDAIWYPVPALEEPTGHLAVPSVALVPTWCFAESHRDLPIRLTSSSDGGSRASYSIMNHVEKFVGPHSLVFSPDLSRLYCGLTSALAVFPLSRPGLNTHSLVPLVPGKRSAGGQRGIVSAIAATAHPSDPTRELVAVGTFNATIGVYSFHPLEFPEPTEHTATSPSVGDGQESLAQRACLAGWREVEGDGITQLKFHPLTPYVLFVASRRSDYIYVYDLRYLMGDTSKWSFRPLAQSASGVRTAHLLAKLSRPGSASHQRLCFDVDWAGRWLATGDEQGMIHLWRIDLGRFVDRSDDNQIEEPQDIELMPDFSWKAHQDTIGSVAFHPHEPWLASVSGSRHWPDTASADSGDSDSGSESPSDAREASSSRRAWTTNDSSLKVWDFSEPPTASAM